MTDQPEEPQKYGRGEHPNVRAVQYGSPDAPPRNQETKGATKPWSIRNVARHLSAQRIKSDNPRALSELLSDNPTVAERMVTAAILKASKGDMRAIEWLGNQIDGKVAETRINAEFAELEGKTDDELIRVVAAFNAHASGGSGEDTGEAAGSTQPADDAGEPAGQTPDTPGV